MYRRVIQKIKVGFTLRGPPCIYVLTLVVPDKIKKSRKTIMCVSDGDLLLCV